jgi:cell division protein FtsQ
MPAVVRGGSRPSARAPKSAAAKPAARGRGGARQPAYAPAKIRAAQKVGLRPGWALAVSAAVAGLGLVVALSTGDRLSRLTAGFGHGVETRMALLGFRLNAVHVEGASKEATADILRAAGLKRDEPILAVDLDDLRGRIERVGWVKSAHVVRLLPDTLVISIVQRRTSAVWQHGGRTYVVDDTGQPIPEADPGRFSDLPLVVGEGANVAATDILPLLRARPRLLERTDALVRVDDRRWDIRLKDGGLIQLPATGEDSALIQLDELDQKSRILDLGFARIDLRDPETVAVRPRDGGAPAPAGPIAGA